MKTFNQSNLWVIYLIVFIDLMGFGIIIPLLPYYVGELQASGFVVAMLMSVYSLMQFIFCPLWGRLSDKIGRKPVLIVSLLGTVISYLMYGIAFIIFTDKSSLLIAIFCSRILAGIMGANITTAYAVICDISKGHDRTNAMGKVGAAFGLGFILGPAIGAGSSLLGPAAPGVIAALLSSIACLIAVFSLGETNGHRSIKKSETAQPRVMSLSFRLVILCSLIYGIAFAAMESIFALFASQQFSLSAWQIGAIFAYLGFIIAVSQGFLVGKITQRISDSVVMLIGMIFMILAYLMIGITESTSLMIVMMGIIALAAGLINPLFPVMIARITVANQQGLTQGIYQSAQSLARIIGPVIAGISYTQFSPHAPFIVGAGFILLALWVLFIWRSMFINLKETNHVDKRRLNYN